MKFLRPCKKNENFNKNDHIVYETEDLTMCSDTKDRFKLKFKRFYQPPA